MIENTKTYNGHTYSGNLLVACQNGYQQGREDVIEEVLQKMKELKLDEHCPVGCHCSSEQDSCPYNECNNDVIRILEQLKEQKNES